MILAWAMHFAETLTTACLLGIRTATSFNACSRLRGKARETGKHDQVLPMRGGRSDDKHTRYCQPNSAQDDVGLPEVCICLACCIPPLMWLQHSLLHQAELPWNERSLPRPCVSEAKEDQS